MPSLGQRRLVWHRRDLRLTDNAVYRDLQHHHDDNNQEQEIVVVSLFVLDPREFYPRTTLENLQSLTRGPHASRLLVDALTDLRRDLRSRGSDLVIRRGNPLLIVPEMAREMGATHVTWSEEPGVYETKISQAMRQYFLNNTTTRPVVECTSCLYHPNDLPFGEWQWSRLAHPKQKQSKRKKKPTVSFEPREDFADASNERLMGMPRVMGDFRRACRSHAQVRPLHTVPTNLHGDLGSIDPGDLPTMEELTKPIQGVSLLGLPAALTDELVANAKRKQVSLGGASCAIAALTEFVHSGRAATANRSLADVSEGNSSRLSAYLAVGALSPRQVYHEAKGIEGCEWLISHMEMRDFFMYYSFLMGIDAFCRDGARGKLQTVEWKSIRSESGCETFTKWSTGKTGLPLIDAAMTELIQTGFCSNRVRQNVASLLSKDLRLDWRAGAEFFQICLEDHCVAANYGNWSYFSGVGSDPKCRHFRTVSQARRYDQKGEYVRKWLPALRNQRDAEVCLRPWDFLQDWPETIVDVKTQMTWQDSQKLEYEPTQKFEGLADCTSLRLHG